LPPRSFQIFDASEVVHDVFRLAEVNLETETNKTRVRGLDQNEGPCERLIKR
jgi:hypothetical protein